MLDMKEPVSGDTELEKRPEQAPEGVPRERVDSYTLKVVDQLFPAPANGVEFLALLLRLARVKQLDLEMEQEQLAAVAVITVQSIKQLARLIGWSYESTHKYVVLFCALGLLIKRRSEGMVELHFPLNRYQPPGVDSLDQLIERYRHPKRNGKTDKRLKHAERVKQRFLCLYGASTPASLPPAPPMQDNVATLIEPDLSAAIGEVEDLLGQAPENLPYTQQLTSLLEKLLRMQKNLPKIQPPVYSGVEPGRLSISEVDSLPTVATRSGRFVATGVDFPPPPSPLSDRLSANKVDSSATEQGYQKKSTHKKREIPAQKVDSEMSDLSANVNVITMINTINVNVSAVAHFCCQVLGESPERWKLYSKLFRDLGLDAPAITAALIYVLAHRDDRRPDGEKWMKNPPAVFTKRCKDYHNKGIPDEAAALVERYGSLTSQQLLMSLQKTSREIGTKAPATIRQESRPHLPPKKIILDSAPPEARPGMTWETYTTLVAQLQIGANTKHMRCCGYYHQADGSYVAWIEDFLGCKRWIYSPEEWQEYASKIQRSTWPKERCSK